MRNASLKICSTLLVSALFSAGCSNLTPGENAGVFGALGGAAAGGIARAAGMRTGESIATGVAAGALIGYTAYVISKHQATERQRALAAERAKVYYGKLSTEKKTALKKKKTRYIAVDTEKSESAPANTKKSVMIWDTQSQEVVGNDVYDVGSTPSKGSTAKFDTYSAEYVGTGS
ncbi:MAG: hypothetical protein QM796_04355 [Chthoniobacteraceae bacterium]